MLDGQVSVIEPSDAILLEDGVGVVPFVPVSPPDVQAVSSTSNKVSTSSEKKRGDEPGRPQGIAPTICRLRSIVGAHPCGRPGCLLNTCTNLYFIVAMFFLMLLKCSYQVREQLSSLWCSPTRYRVPSRGCRKSL